MVDISPVYSKYNGLLVLQEAGAVDKLRGLFLCQGGSVEVAAAAHDVPGGVREELDADRIRGAARPCSLPSPGSRAPSETVVQISILALAQSVVISVVIRLTVEEGKHSIVVVDLLQVVETQGVTGQAAVGPLQVELEAALQISQWVTRAGTLAAGLGGDGDVGDSGNSIAPAPWWSISTHSVTG